jgi:26S proteasome regulatory subunit N7
MNNSNIIIFSILFILYVELLAYVEQYMKLDRYFFQHYTFYTREMRIIAYNQLLESYSSLTLSYMANAFGVSVDFVDR